MINWAEVAGAAIPGVLALILEISRKVLYPIQEKANGRPHGKRVVHQSPESRASRTKRSEELKGARNLSLILFAASTAITVLTWLFPQGIGSGNHGVETRITVTETPPADPQGGPWTAGHHIGGVVSGVTPADFRIVIYAHTRRWYVQPEAASPLTGITSDGKWESDTCLGDRYAVLLVKPSYLPPQDVASLPGVGGDVVYLTTVAGK